MNFFFNRSAPASPAATTPAADVNDTDVQQPTAIHKDVKVDDGDEANSEGSNGNGDGAEAADRGSEEIEAAPTTGYYSDPTLGPRIFLSNPPTHTTNTP